MMGESPHGEAARRTNESAGAGAADAEFEQLEPLAHDLAADGTLWRSQHAVMVEKIELRLHAALQTWLGEPAKRTQATGSDGRVAGLREAHRMDQQAPGDRPRREGRGAAVRGRRGVTALGGIAGVLAAATAAVIAVALQRPAPAPTSGAVPPPPLYVFSRLALRDSMTPEEAFAAGVTLTPCQGPAGPGPAPQSAPPRTATVTWLDAGPNYGLALIRVTCPPQARSYPAVWLFSLGRDAQHHWIPQAGYIVSNNPANPAPAPSSGQVPPWLALPPDRYIPFGRPGSRGVNPAASVAAWYAPARTFVFGHVADPAARPEGATPVVVDGHAGWATDQDGIATVTVPLPDGTTAFFGGTGPVEQIESLVASALDHMDEVLAPVTR